MTKRSLPYGSWPSPIDAAAVARHDGAPNWPATLEEEVWWTEPRPGEGGRVTLCRVRLDSSPGGVETVLPAPWNVRNRVHEYGGRPYVLFRGGDGPVVVFSEYSDQRLYRYEPGRARHPHDPAPGPVALPRPLTPEPGLPSGVRYAEPVVTPDGTEVWCVRELHTGPAPTDVERAIVAVPLDGSAAEDPRSVRIVASGHRFLACPRISPDGRRLAWIGWDHPDMPWDSTALMVGEITEDGRVDGARRVAGGKDQAVVQVEWVNATTLYCVTDPQGWWNPHQLTLDPEGEAVREPVNLCRRDEEFGGPLWQTGATWSAPLPDGRIAVVHGRAATSLGLLSPDSGELVDLTTPHTEWSGRITLGGAAGNSVIGVAFSPTLPAEVVSVSTVTGEWQSLSRPPGDDADDPFADYLPRPQAMVVRGPGGRDVHANLYPPHNPEATGPEGTPAPYVVFVHGGPTSRAPMVHDLEIAYFTSRGIGVAEVNYGGSTGHGRAYRERLRGTWGIVDVDDCVAVARDLAERGLADPERLAIRGGSAGGWTAAAALASTDVFRCGAILYPILDLVGWRTGETHDFESRYLETLVGPWPQERRRYEERSPVNRADSINAPFVLLQGLEDEICPPVQSERFLERIQGRGVPHAYLAFAGEQHGFRQEATIRAALNAELSLYAQVFGFETDAEPVELRP
ncbi:prolyl oligopeptidase family serine peptidase [Marinactinospora thermotolerans]|uniref:Dipeptidyl aminopeptidase/acylaminoacyl peptidase n=1 Tax=Marinactinospora thermotolerans DSM 45154 TaxID=1122192 RepID=A0A1T4M9N5_9ACTN|nr:prolyl oligopeptidase family serine peptidase [Marinactinospora thermotolerans]SJZ63723.1 Dipeptidyl aminopeptidase/acylaminoacyl peptidase [Marinactinospora thermotolerans DSM 45154]